MKIILLSCTFPSLMLFFLTSSSMADLFLTSFVVLVLGYLGYVRYYRYEHLNKMIKKYPDPDAVLQNHDIAMEIYSDIFRKEFPCK